MLTALAERIVTLPEQLVRSLAWDQGTTDLGAVTQDELNVAAELNGRPRQTLGWWSPSEKFAEAVAKIP